MRFAPHRLPSLVRCAATACTVSLVLVVAPAATAGVTPWPRPHRGALVAAGDLAASTVEGERLPLPASSGAVFADASASGSAALLLWSNSTATGALATTTATDRLAVVVRGDQCDGPPTLQVRVDGRLVVTTSVAGSTWTTVTTTGSWPAGSHAVAVAFTNDTRTAYCDRNLRLDKVSLAQAAATNPLSGLKLYVDPSSNARQEIQRRAADPASVALLRKIADQPDAIWFGDWVPISGVRARVAAVTTAAAAKGSTAVLVLYAVPHRDCGSFSLGGLAGPGEYSAWVREVAAGVAGRRTVVVVEPDALAGLDCLSSTARTERTAMLRDAVLTLRSSSAAVVYLDAGNSGWITSDVMAARLRAAGVQNAHGFSTNVSSFHWTTDEMAYARRVSTALGGAHFVIDTSRNGLGPLGGAMDWCNPSGRALGARPTTTTGTSADAYLWVKAVGESDGECGRGEPAAGTWWADYALGLAARAAW